LAGAGFDGVALDRVEGEPGLGVVAVFDCVVAVAVVGGWAECKGEALVLQGTEGMALAARRVGAEEVLEGVGETVVVWVGRKAADGGVGELGGGEVAGGEVSGVLVFG